jgi:tryptophan synthase alpha subunit
MGADGVIVGSLTVEMLLRGRGELEAMLRSMREVLDGR